MTKKCPHCDGTGLRYDIGFGDRLTSVGACSYCDGTGEEND